VGLQERSWAIVVPLAQALRVWLVLAWVAVNTADP